jgi:hypothetical protein
VDEKISGTAMAVRGVMVFADTLILIPGRLPYFNRFAL